MHNILFTLGFFSTEIYQNVIGLVPENTYKKYQCRTKQYGKFTKISFERYRKARTKKKSMPDQTTWKVYQNAIWEVPESIHEKKNQCRASNTECLSKCHWGGMESTHEKINVGQNNTECLANCHWGGTRKQTRKTIEYRTRQYGNTLSNIEC